ncbi:sulfotransferase domain-containing protein [Rhodovibrio salinarum]|uniref:Sulfotransferase domain-containing protein n=1 Tax=Rhodovibrio salinarum TaxID=1087 RepID=A0A934QFY0_9PROT|nr:sulfotransferase domain-containing protein [Rhodovibrio salinarum]MBK1696033.1 hypothetical protein [Rhodovibrio salinarum]
MLPSAKIDRVWKWQKTGLHQALRLLARPSDKRILLVSGVQRSGTNLVLGTLDASLDTSVFFEGDPRAFDRFALRDVECILNLTEQANTSLVVFKSLLEAGELADWMDATGASAIWVFRSYTDMVNSYLRKWPGGRNRLDEIADGRALEDWRARGIRDETLDMIRQHYDPAMSDADAIALFWAYRNQMFFDQGLADKTNVLLLFYDDFVRRPAVVGRQVCRFAQIPYTPSLTRAVKTSSLKKNDPPRLRPDITELCEEMMARLKAVYEPS